MRTCGKVGIKIFPLDYVYDQNLFSGNYCIGKYNHFGRPLTPQYTLEQYLNDLAFSDWNLRGTAISFYNMLEELGLNKEKSLQISVPMS